MTGRISEDTTASLGGSLLVPLVDLSQPAGSRNVKTLLSALVAYFFASPTFTGTVTGVSKAAVGLGNVDNTADSSKPVSTAQQTALDLKANLASPPLSGIPTAPTAVAGTNTTQIATTGFTQSAIAALVASSPAALDTLNELAAALGNDPAFATTVTTSLATKAPLASPTFTGTVGGVTKSMVGLGSVDNTADTGKPVSTAQAAAIALKANAASPTFTGITNAPAVQVNTSTLVSDEKLSVNNPTASSWAFGLQCNNRGSIMLATATSGIFAYYSQGTVGNNVGQITYTTTTTSYGTTSDKRKKRNPKPFTRSGEIIDRTEIWDCEWILSGERAVVVYAQDAYEVFPDAILKPENPEDTWSADYSKYVPVLLEEMKRMRIRMAALEASA